MRSPHDIDRNAAMFKLTQGITLELGESARQLQATVRMDARDEEVAASLHSIVQGVVSLMRLEEDKPEQVRLAKAISIAQEGSQVVGTLSLPAKDLVEMMKAGAERKAKQN